MKLHLVLSGSLALSVTGCPGEDDEPEGEDGTSSAATQSSTAASASTAGSNTASTASTASSDPSTTDASDSMTTSSTPTSDAESSTGEEGCAADRAMAPVSEVDGCADVIGVGFCSEGAPHVEDGTEIVWQNNPPHSGPHYPMWQTWGEHEETVPRGNWVHNLEHGGVVFTYLCPDGCEEDLAVLRDVIAQRPDLRILMTSDPELGAPGFAAVSWTWVYTFATPDLATLLCFVDQHEGNAPEDIP